MTAIAQPSLTIDGITEPIIVQYFETLNAGHYQQAASLFALEGALYPPFQEEVSGPEAIATYLESEAIGMKLMPHRGTLEILETGNCQYSILGTVQTPLFGVNVGWQIVLNPNSQILSVQVKLLAALEELLSLKS